MASGGSKRRIIGIVGCPGAGKSSLAARLVADERLGAVVVPMDGFHLAQAELERLGIADRKGAPDTFDAHGYADLLERIVRHPERTVYAPAFDRHLEEPIANAIAIEPHHKTIVTEGNYLLLDEGGWARVRPLLDECRYLDLDDDIRRDRLIARHVAHGRSLAEAASWIDEVDEPNAVLIRATRHAADVIVIGG
jgi:pantothenate kinase